MLKLRLMFSAALLLLLATGGVAFNARAIDTDHDGSISKEEFLAYAEHKFDKMKHSDGMITVQEAAKAFARGGPPPGK